MDQLAAKPETQKEDIRQEIHQQREEMALQNEEIRREIQQQRKEMQAQRGERLLPKDKK